MKTLQINLAITLIFLVVSFAVNAQSSKTKSTSVQQRTETKQQIKLSENIPSSTKSVVVSATPSQRPARVSEYMSMEKIIMERSVSGQIPASLPKHVEGQTKEQYTEIIRNWAKNNLSLVKPEYHDEILNPKTKKTSNTK